MNLEAISGILSILLALYFGLTSDTYLDLLMKNTIASAVLGLGLTTSYLILGSLSTTYKTKKISILEQSSFYVLIFAKIFFFSSLFGILLITTRKLFAFIL